VKEITRAWMVGAAIGLGAMTAAAQTPPAQDTKQADTERLIELLRKDVRAEKADIVAKTMKLDAAQAAAFWPIYKAYEVERQGLGDQRVAVIKDLAQNFDRLDDAKARILLDRAFGVTEQRMAIDRKYRDQFLKVLPAKVVTRFFQVESRLNNLIDLAISSEIPLLR
jgi:hypothetical protein